MHTSYHKFTCATGRVAIVPDIYKMLIGTEVTKSSRDLCALSLNNQGASKNQLARGN